METPPFRMPQLYCITYAVVNNVVSEGTSGGIIDFDDLLDAKVYKPVVAYSQSKQAEIFFTHELAERLKGTKITANCFYPGLVKTNLGKAVDKGFISNFGRLVMITLLTFLFTPMEESIKVGLFLSAGNTNGMTGKYLKRKKSKVIIISKYDREASQHTAIPIRSGPFLAPRGCWLSLDILWYIQSALDKLPGSRALGLRVCSHLNFFLRRRSSP